MTIPTIGSARNATWPLYKRLLQRSSLPVLCGPFTGEVGFEALYWVPFVKKLGIAKDRLIPITRGGAQIWYPATRGVELFSLREPKEYRIQNALRYQRFGQMKQQGWSDFDKALIKDAAAKLGLKKYLVLHPSWMYQQFNPFWAQAKGIGWLGEQVDISPFPALEIEGVTLPEKFAAVRFYARTTFPLSEATQTIARETIKTLAQSHPVILLNSPVAADEHIDIDVKDVPNVMKLTDLIKVTPENNLLAQSAILSKCMGFVGTYGGLAQLALMYRKPTVSLYTDWKGTALAHKHYADAIALQYGVACNVLKATEIPLLHAVLPKLQITAPSSSSGAA